MDIKLIWKIYFFLRILDIGFCPFFIMSEEQIQIKPEVIEEGSAGVQLPFMVVVFNDDWHTFEEVIVQIMKATKCGFDQARALTFQIHVKGKAIVYSGPLPNCLKVTSVLEEIALHTQIVSE